MYTRFSGLVFASLLLAPLAGLADDAAKQKITAKLKAVMPNAEIGAVTAAPIKGLYEVEMGPNIAYVSEDGHYALVGDLRDLEQHRNITEEHRGKARLSALKGIKPEQMIEFAPASPKHLVYVFTDVDCAYCRKLHKEVGQLNNAGIAVRYLAFPRAGLDSESFRKTVSVWCAKDPKAALTDAKNGKDVVPASCENPVKKEYELGLALGVKGTPTLILENGQELGGYMPADRLAAYINSGGTEGTPE
jgi:thiol:disulfide interchange protein DsbC